MKGEMSVHKGFAKGLIIGGVIGATVGMMMDTKMVNGRTGRRMVRSGRSFIRKSGNLICDLIDVLR